MRVGVFVFKVLALTLGLVAVLHFVAAEYGCPLVFMVEVEGESMQPTLEPGERVLFIRRAWHQRDVVVADVGEEKLVVKRVVRRWRQWAYLAGDNGAVSRDYWVLPADIKSVMLCPVPLPRAIKTCAASQPSDAACAQQAGAP